MSSVPDRGYLFVTCGNRSFLQEAAVAAGSIRRVDPRAHITLVDDHAPGDLDDESLKVFDTAIESSSDLRVQSSPSENARIWKNGVLYKVRNMYSQSPYEYTFFADSDTYFLEDCSHLFDLLDFFDICIAQAPGDQSLISHEGKELVGYTPYNSGVMLFRKSDRVRQLFEDWEKFFIENFEIYRGNQPALMHAFLHSDCSVYVLQNLYNARFTKYERFAGRVKVLHGRHADLERVARKINRTSTKRVWFPGVEECFGEESKRSPNLAHLRMIGRMIRGAAGAPLRERQRRKAMQRDEQQEEFASPPPGAAE